MMSNLIQIMASLAMTALIAGVGQYYLANTSRWMKDQETRLVGCCAGICHNNWRSIEAQWRTAASAGACETITFPDGADKLDFLVGNASDTIIAYGCTHDSASATKFCRGVWASTETQKRAGSSADVHKTTKPPADANKVNLLVGNAFGNVVTYECTHDGTDAIKCNPRLVRVPVGKHSVATHSGCE